MSKYVQVYLICYDAVWKMSIKRAKQFATACLSGVGSTQADDYGKRLKRMAVTRNDESHTTIEGWCHWRGYPCFKFTDFTLDDWRSMIASLDELTADPYLEAIETGDTTKAAKVLLNELASDGQ